MNNHLNQQWEITPTRPLLSIPFKEIWDYRDLLVLLVRRDFVSVYKQTILGPLWFFLQPLFTTVIFTFVFSNLAGISTAGLPGPLFYMAGITLWNYFSDCVIKTAAVFRDNAAIFQKIYFPRMIVPISIVVSNLARFGIQMLLLIIILIYYVVKGAVIQPNEYILLFPVVVVCMAILGLGAGMIISALTTKYRDLSFLLTFGVQLLMYATTVIMPLSAAPEKYKWIIELNPMTQVIETFRFGVFGKGAFSWSSLLYCTSVSLIILAVGAITYNRVEKDFVDTV